MGSVGNTLSSISSVQSAAVPSLLPISPFLWLLSSSHKTNVKVQPFGFFLLHTLRIPEFRQALRLCFTKRRAAIQTDEIEGKKTNGCTFNDGERVQDITNCSHSRVKRV